MKCICQHALYPLPLNEFKRQESRFSQRPNTERKGAVGEIERIRKNRCSEGHKTSIGGWDGAKVQVRSMAQVQVQKKHPK